MVKFHKFLHLRCHPGRVWSSESIAATHMADLDSANSPAHQAARDSHNGLHHRKAALESAKSPTARALGPAATLLFHFSSSESHRFDSVRRSRPICQTNDYILDNLWNTLTEKVFDCFYLFPSVDDLASSHYDNQ